VPLPSQPVGRSWPTLTWATAEAAGDGDRLDDLMDRAFHHNPNADLALSLACVVVQGGRVVAERYSPRILSPTPLISWSMGKSMLHAAVGIAVADGLMDLDAPLLAPEWADPQDPRRDITLRQLLTMRDGLDFSEDYVDAGTSNCLEMLFGEGLDDVAHYAASLPSAVPAGERFNYSSGTTNIVSRALGDTLVSGGATADQRRSAVEAFLRDRLFGPIGMSAEPRFDAAGTWVASSYVYATARDFARFGLLYLRVGVWDGTRVLPEGWVDQARTWVSTDPEDGLGYGAQWWLYDDGLGTFAAKGYEGQAILCVPALDLVVVRLGKTPIEHRPTLEAWYGQVIDCFRP
jgi:CubicO group peptidase (beta-lactamase class C family)